MVKPAEYLENPDALVRDAVRRLVEKDRLILENQLWEVCLTHRLAVHLERLLDGICDVDCEYNKQLFVEGHPEKQVKQKDLRARLEEVRPDILEQYHGGTHPFRPVGVNPERYIDGVMGALNTNEEEKEFRPDVIVHQRGTQKNFVVIEAKWLRDYEQKKVLLDIAKLCQLTHPDSQLKYKLGYFLVFAASGALHLVWRFEGGKFTPLSLESFTVPQTPVI